MMLLLLTIEILAALLAIEPSRDSRVGPAFWAMIGVAFFTVVVMVKDAHQI